MINNFKARYTLYLFAQHTKYQFKIDLLAIVYYIHYIYYDVPTTRASVKNYLQLS